MSDGNPAEMSMKCGPASCFTNFCSSIGVVYIAVWGCFLFLPSARAQDPVPESLSSVLNTTVQAAVSQQLKLDEGDYVAVSQVRLHGAWLVGVATPLRRASTELDPQSFMFLGFQTKDKLQVAVQNTSTFREWVKDVPDEILPRAAKDIYGQASVTREASTSTPEDVSPEFAFPWPVGVSYRYLQGPTRMD